MLWAGVCHVPGWGGAVSPTHSQLLAFLWGRAAPRGVPWGFVLLKPHWSGGFGGCGRCRRWAFSAQRDPHSWSPLLGGKSPGLPLAPFPRGESARSLFFFFGPFIGEDSAGPESRRDLTPGLAPSHPHPSIPPLPPGPATFFRSPFSSSSPSAPTLTSFLFLGLPTSRLASLCLLHPPWCQVVAQGPGCSPRSSVAVDNAC